ncbi:MAG: YigZ family protein [Synergistaceae bacterium]|nr:YigZ family protein [Synergistaceae bacterium]
MPLEPESPVTYEEKIKRSVFIADVFPCHDEEEARSILADVTSKYRDATHNCRAYVLADGTEYSSDDGEPSGTAGKPILGAIKRSGLVNVMVIVTRYFGGVKLGVRGLIDAYGDTAMKALEVCGKIERVITSTFRIALGYNAVGNVTRLLEGTGAVNLRWDYTENVSVSADVPEGECERIARELEEMKARGIIAEWEKVS